MKTNTENKNASNAAPALETVPVVKSQPAGLTRLKLLVAGAALIAAGLTYQTVVAVIDLNQALTSCHNALAQEGESAPPVSGHANFFETNVPLAGL